jgi:hypothetical protein
MQRRPKGPERIDEVYERQTGLRYRIPVPIESKKRLAPAALKAFVDPPKWAYSSLPYYMFDKKVQAAYPRGDIALKHTSEPQIAFPKIQGMGSA